MQTQQIRFRLSKDEIAVLNELGASVLSAQSVAAMLLSAAIHAVKESPGSLTFPPKFAVTTVPTHDTDRIIRLNEPTGKTKGK